MSDSLPLAQVLLLVEQSLVEPELDGAALAARAHLSRFHFDRLVHAAVGEPPGAFRRRLLLERAAVRLATTAARVIEVASEAGYASPDAFTRAFARAYGRAPRDYRCDPPSDHTLPGPSGVHSTRPAACGCRLFEGVARWMSSPACTTTTSG